MIVVGREKDLEADVRLNVEILKTIDCFSYLGTEITSDGKIQQQQVSNRLKKVATGGFIRK